MQSYALRHNQLLGYRLAAFLRKGGGWYLVLLLSLLALATGVLFSTSPIRAAHQEAQAALDSRLQELDVARRNLALSEQMLQRAVKSQPSRAPYLVISIKERRLWYKDGETVLMTTPVATGSGKTLVKEQGNRVWKFETPRGALTVERKEENPVWVPPDWFYVEQARKKHLGLARLERGQVLAAGDGSIVKVEGRNVVRRYPDGRGVVLKATEQKYLTVSGRILIPPLDSNQRRFDKVLGTHRLVLGGGYGLHGTNKPETVGQAVSHGCVRLFNEEIAKLYRMVPVGTRVYIY